MHHVNQFIGLVDHVGVALAASSVFVIAQELAICERMLLACIIL